MSLGGPLTAPDEYGLGRPHISQGQVAHSFLARPEGLEPPTTWFEVTSTSSTIQLEQSLATLAAFANPT